MMEDTNIDIEEWRKSVDHFIIDDIRICLDKNIIEVGLVILCLVAIDSLSGYYCGKTSAKDTFIAFLNSRYFGDEYHSVADDIWCFRNGLFHDYSLDRDNFILYRDKPDPNSHLKTVDDRLVINREILAHDVIQAWYRLSEDAQTDTKLQNNIIKRIKCEDRGFLIITNARQKTSQSLLRGSSPSLENSHTSDDDISIGGPGTVSFKTIFDEPGD